MFLWLLVINTKRAVKFSSIALIFLLYSLIVSYTSRFHEFSIIFNLYYITTIFFYFYYKEMLKICNAVNIYTFLTYLYKILIVLGFIQFFFGGVYFNTQDRLPAVNLFFWNENEFSSILAIFTPLFFLKSKSIYKFLWIFPAIILIAHNEAKLAILSLLVFFAGYYVLKFKLFRIRYIGLVVLGILTVLVLFFIREYTIQGKYTIEFFVSRLYEGLINQEPLEHIGSFNSRSNAVILGVKEFIHSYGLGIGPGNSLLMIDEVLVPGLEKYGALSMHNFTLQVITEIGVLGILFIIIFLMKVEQAATLSTYSNNLVWVYYLSCVISITLLSGAWSNYFYLFILFYSIDFFKENV